MAKSSDIIKIGFDYRASLEQFEKETNGVFDGISEKAGKQKISIQLDAKNDKVIEKIKELQKLKLDKFTFEFGESGLAEQLKTFDQLEKKITEIINLSKGLETTSSPIIDVNDSTVQIDKLQNKLDELSKKYDELSSKKIGSSISSKDINLVDNEEFKRLSDEFSLLKDELTGLKREMQLFEEATVSADTFVSMERSVNGLIVKVDDLIDKYVQLSVAQKNINPVETNISSGEILPTQELDSAVKKYQEIVALVKEYYELFHKLQKPTKEFQTRPEDYDRIDGYLLSKSTSQKVGHTDIERDINERYHKMSKGINEGKEFAIKAMKSAIQRYWSDVTEMPSDDKLLSSRKTIPYGNKKRKEEYIIPKKYRELEKSVIEETIVLNKNNAAYEEERQQIKANNTAIKERMNIIRSMLKSEPKNKDYDGDYRMGLSLKANDGKTDIFNMAQSMSYEDMLKEICNMLGVEIPKASEKAQSALKEVADAQKTQSSTSIKDTFQGDTKVSAESSAPAVKDESKAMEQVAESAEKASKAKNEFSDANERVDKGAKKSFDSIKDESVHLDKISDMVTNYRKSLKDLSTIPDGNHRFASFESQLNDLNIAITELENHQTSLKNKDFVSEDDIVKTNKLSDNITTLIETIKKIPKSERGFADLGVSKMAEKINSILKENPRLSRRAKEKIRAYYKELTTGNPTKPLNEIYDAVNRIIQKEREAGRAGKGFLDIFNNKLLYEGAGKLAGYFLGFTDFIRYAQDGFEIIKEYDKALTEMNKVSNETISTLKEFQQESFDTADSIGATASAIQNSTAGWMKLGYSLKDSAELSEWANIYANVGDMEIDEATEHMISSVKAWSSEFANDIEASEAIVDRYNHIGNSYAITSADIGEAMETSAAALKAGGNSLNESLGLIVSGNLIQQDASTTSSALKILSLRIRGAKAELEEMQESTEGLADSSSKMREEIQALTGVDIMLDEDTFKSTAQIIKEIGSIWDSMSDVSQAATLEKIAGKNRASTVAGLIENYELIDDVIKSAEEAQGSALKENQRYVESIEGSLNRLSSAWDKLWVNENNREAITFFIDLGRGILEVVDNIGILNTAIIGIGAFAGIKNVGIGMLVAY